MNKGERQRRRRKQRRELGICRDCAELAQMGRVRCKKCRDANYWIQRKYNKKNAAIIREKSRLERMQRIKNGRCTRCGKDLNPKDAPDENINDGFVTCINCRLKIYSRKMESNHGINDG